MQEKKKEYLPKDEELSDPEEQMQVQPLITKKHERNASYNNSVYDVRFKNFDENEEATKINRIICIQVSYFKVCIVVPILAICTAMFFLLFLYWFPKLRKKFFYNECRLEHATHLFIMGTCK